jgi:hypothetical protein
MDNIEALKNTIQKLENKLNNYQETIEIINIKNKLNEYLIKIETIDKIDTYNETILLFEFIKNTMEDLLNKNIILNFCKDSLKEMENNENNDTNISNKISVLLDFFNNY